MIDVTDAVETKVKQRVNGRSVQDELWHEGKQIGVMEPQGPVVRHPAYRMRLVPNERHNLTQRIFQLEDDELEA